MCTRESFRRRVKTVRASNFGKVLEEEEDMFWTVQDLIDELQHFPRDAVVIGWVEPEGEEDSAFHFESETTDSDGKTTVYLNLDTYWKYAIPIKDLGEPQ